MHTSVMQISHQTPENKASCSFINSGFNKEKKCYLPYLVDLYDGTFSCVL